MHLNHSLQRDQERFVTNMLRGLPHSFTAPLLPLANAARNEPTVENNKAFRKAATKKRQQYSRKMAYLQGWKIPAKVINTKERTRELAQQLASQCYSDMCEVAEEFETEDFDVSLVATYDRVRELSLLRMPHIQPPLADYQVPETMECALLRLKCEKWWTRKLLKLRKQHLETLEILTGKVGRETSPYASSKAVAEFVRDKEAQRRWAESLLLINEAGDELALINAIEASVANPENARAELMKRIRGIEEHADELGFVPVFLTLTAPSRMHPSSQKWDGSTPRDTQNYLVDVWAKARSTLNRCGFHYFGVRVAEPHKDGAPHWHMLLFTHPADLRAMCRIIRRYFCTEDMAELMQRFKNRKALRKKYKKARQRWGLAKHNGYKVAEPRKFYMPFQPRFDAEFIDPSRGSAAAYIAKYISKNINGHEVADLIDKETGKTLGQGVCNVKTWSSVWCIRQFQFQGCDPITAYREIRRVREAFADEHMHEVEKLRAAADSNNFIDFIRAMKTISTDLQYEITPYGNAYGEATKRVKGLAVCGVTVCTRPHKWVMRRKAQKVGAADKSWTCGINCTPPAFGPSHGQNSPNSGKNRAGSELPHYQPPAKADLHGIDAEAMALLNRGYTVVISGQRWKLRHGSLEQLPDPPHPSGRVNYIVRMRGGQSSRGRL